jgi:hypothetical protein
MLRPGLGGRRLARELVDDVAAVRVADEMEGDLAVEEALVIGLLAIAPAQAVREIGPATFRLAAALSPVQPCAVKGCRLVYFFWSLSSALRSSGLSRQYQSGSFSSAGF